MFRRRPFRRLQTAAGRSRPLRRVALNQLRLANRYFDEGKWHEAAEVYESLANAAEKRGMPQTPQLYLRAGRSWLQHGDHEAGIKLLKHAVRSFPQFGQTGRLYHIRPRLVDGLNQLGFEREAVELNQLIHGLLDQSPPITTSAFDRQGRFPAKCVSCGATLRPDEMEFLDPQTGVCGYCGSVNHAV